MGPKEKNKIPATFTIALNILNNNQFYRDTMSLQNVEPVLISDRNSSLFISVILRRCNFNALCPQCFLKG